MKLSVVGLGKLSVVKECTCVRQMWPSTDNRGLLLLKTYVAVFCQMGFRSMHWQL